MPEEHVSKHFTAFIVSLSNKDWFTSRLSAASLFHVAYNRLPDSEKRNLRTLFLRLCTDDTPSVRRAAAQNFGNLIKHVKPAEVLSEFISTFNSISVDEQDSVRIQVITTCITLADILTTDQQALHVLPVILAVGSDKSWRVRWSLATRLHELCGPLGDQVANESLSVVFEQLLGDSEAEVRSAAAGRIAIVSSFLRKSTVIIRLLPAVQRLVTDASEHVRASLACVVNRLATSLGKDDTVERLLPIILLLLRDEVSEVRLNIISNLDAMSSVVSIDLLSQSLLPAIVDLAEDSKWRVRLAIIELIPVLAIQLGKDYFGNKLSILCMAWLDDPVYSIRREATENLLRLAELFGEDWAIEHILPRVDKMRGHKNYLHRTTALYALQVLVRCLSQHVIEKTVLPMVLQMCDDAVPNIRFISAKTLQAVAERCQNLSIASGAGPSSYKSSVAAGEISSALSKLVVDQDRDVKFYANAALSETTSTESRGEAM